MIYIIQGGLSQKCHTTMIVVHKPKKDMVLAVLLMVNQPVSESFSSAVTGFRQPQSVTLDSNVSIA